MTSFWCSYYKLRTYFTPYSSVSIADFKQLNVSWVVTFAELMTEIDMINMAEYAYWNV